VKVNKSLLNKIASDYHLSGNEPDMFIENTCQRYELDWVSDKIKSGSSVLDLGYGDGLFLEKIASRNETTLIEGSTDLVNAAKLRVQELGLNVKVVNSLFEDFTPESKFDAIIASHVLEHVDDPSLLLTRIKSWIKPKGVLICIVPNRESLHRQLGVKMGLIGRLDELSARDKVVGHQRVYSYNQLKADLDQSGFAVSEARGFFTKTLANSQMLNLTEDVIWGLCELSEDLPIELGANLGIVAVLGDSIDIRD
jgi:2-polyprenyl-3-methyl-5-hydroxy-6-metoxy-1,4-benzoquinol methylase